MAKLYFFYSAMNAGKSTSLLQASHNYMEKGMQSFLFAPRIDKRFGRTVIASRIGLKKDAIPFDKSLNFFSYIEGKKLDAVLIDEAQFLTKKQVWQLSEITTTLNIPVLCYGLRTDFQGEPFEGSQYLLAIAEELIEIRTVCSCGRKGTMNLRIDSQGRPIREGEQVKIGGNESYISKCIKCYKESMKYDNQIKISSNI